MLQPISSDHFVELDLKETITGQLEGLGNAPNLLNLLKAGAGIEPAPCCLK